MLAALIIASLVGGGLYFFGKGAGVQNFANNLSYKASVKSVQVKGLGLQITLDLLFENPTTTQVKIANLLVKVLFSGSEVAKNKYNTKTYTITANGKSKIENLVFDFKPTVSMISTIGLSFTDAFSLLKSGEKLKSIVESKKSELLKKIDVQITMDVNGIPVDYKQNLAA